MALNKQNSRSPGKVDLAPIKNIRISKTPLRTKLGAIDCTASEIT